MSVLTCFFFHQPIPNWFSYDEVVKVLRESYPPRNKQGFTSEFAQPAL